MIKYKQNRKLIQVECKNCGKKYDKPISEYNRNKKLNRNSFCSRSCAGSFNNKNIKRKRKYDHLLNYNKNKKSNPFLYYMKIIKQRFYTYNVTSKELEEQWNLQKGICPYSGINLQLASHINTKINPIYRASLDRIDSSKGYIIGNIQFVSTPINYMKHTLSSEDALQLCKLISKNYS